MALVVSRAGSLDPAELRRRGVPLLMLQAGIHPGESDGKDAGFIALRELLSGAVSSGVLERVALLFVPAFNTDGHERTGRANRPNQNGPPGLVLLGFVSSVDQRVGRRVLRLDRRPLLSHGRAATRLAPFLR